jgi:hypothetical protein
MSQQLMYQAIVGVLRATKTVTKRLEPARATPIQERIHTLELASRRAFEARDYERLRTLCAEVSQLGDEVRRLLAA